MFFSFNLLSDPYKKFVGFFGRKDISKLINLYLQQQQNLRNTENFTLYCVLLSYMRESLRRRKVGGWSRTEILSEMAA